MRVKDKRWNFKEILYWLLFFLNYILDFLGVYIYFFLFLGVFYWKIGLVSRRKSTEVNIFGFGVWCY